MKRRWPAALVLGVLGLIIGVVVASALATPPKETAEYQAMSRQTVDVSGQLSDTKGELDAKELELTQTESDLQASQSEVTGLESKVTELKGNIPRREAAVKSAEKAVLKREEAATAARRAVTADAKAVVKREKAVGLVETEIENNTLNDGVYQVGTDIKAGTYKTEGASGCYYAVLNSPDTSDIANNSFNDGPTVVSVSNGQYLNLSCDGADWVLQR